MWAWPFACRKQRFGPSWFEVISLPRELSLPEDGILRIKPLRELEQLRRNPAVEKELIVKHETLYRLKDIAGDAIELSVTLEQGEARAYGVRVLCDKTNDRGLDIGIVETDAPNAQSRIHHCAVGFTAGRAYPVAYLRGSQRGGSVRQRPAGCGQTARLRPGRCRRRLFSKGGQMKVRELKAWTMAALNPL